MANKPGKKVNLKELAMFKLCPTMYKHHLLNHCESNSTNNYRMIMAEAEIFANSFSAFAEKSITENAVYKRSDILCLTNIIDEVRATSKDYFDAHNEFSKNDIPTIINGVFTKVKYAMDQIHQSVRGDDFKIAPGTENPYYIGDISFMYECAYRVFDMQRKTYRSIFVNEYKDFPKLSLSARRNDIMHYNEILTALKLNKTHTDRTLLIFNMMRKINIQIETGYYLDDGLERIANLCDELTNYDFENATKIKSDFCPYCKYFEKCY